MPVAAQILAGSLLLGGILAMLLGLKGIARRLGWSAEVSRKIVHVATGLTAIVLPWVLTDDRVFFGMLGLAALAMLALRLPKIARAGEALHGVDRQSYGEFFLIASIALLHVLADGQAILYVLPLAVLTLSDAAAALTGSTYGKRFFTVEGGQKSVEGSTMFFLVTVILSMVCLLLLTEVPRENVIFLSLMAAVFATLVEADSWRGFDNLFLPMVLVLFLALSLDDSTGGVIARALLLLFMIGGFGVLARAMGMDRHAARVHVIAIFLILSVTTAHNALLPVLMLAASGLARVLHPSRDEWPDLDVVGGLAIVSFGSLGVGFGFGQNALNFYGLATGSMATGLLALSVARTRIGWRLAVAGASGALFYGLWLAVMTENGAFAGWHSDLAVPGAGLFILVTAICVWRPAIFAHHRMLKLVMLGGGGALALYLGYLVKEGLLWS